MRLITRNKSIKIFKDLRVEVKRETCAVTHPLPFPCELPQNNSSADRNTRLLTAVGVWRTYSWLGMGWGITKPRQGKACLEKVAGRRAGLILLSCNSASLLSASAGASLWEPTDASCKSHTMPLISRRHLGREQLVLSTTFVKVIQIVSSPIHLKVLK